MPALAAETHRSTRQGTTMTTTATTTTTTTMERPQKKYSHMHYLDACKIWFNPDGPRAAGELKQLSLEEREKVWADLTGREATTTYTQNVVEDEEVMKQKLTDLNTALFNDDAGALPNEEYYESRDAFELALKTNPEYVQDLSFRLKFLRASGYDAYAAASRMIQHFEMKKSLFGNDALGRDIILSDLDTEIINTGCCQPLQGTDIGGRKVVLDRPGLMHGISRKSLFQWIWYLRMSLAEDENVQKLGIVNVVYCLDTYCRQDLETIRQFHRTLASAVPLKISARYAVYNDDAWKQVLDFEQVIMKKPARMRFRSIRGTYKQCMHSLMCVGIPIQSLPVDIIEGYTGRAKGDYLHSWLDDRRQADSNKRLSEDYEGSSSRKSKRARKN